MAVTIVPGKYQCAETQSTARGRDSVAPILAQDCVYSLRASAFIGLPCPKKMAGIVSTIFVTPRINHQPGLFVNN
jgi:hypothetical protein